LLFKKVVYKVDRRVRMFLVWTLICGMNSGVGLAYGSLLNYNHEAMIMGISLFIIIFTLLSFSSVYSKIREKRFTFIAMWIWYILSCLVTCYHYLIGAFSLRIIEGLHFVSRGFVETLLTTILMGSILNIIAIIVLWVVTQCKILCIRMIN
jgi:hypothetical protein